MIFKDEKQVGFIFKGDKCISKLYKNGKLVFEKGFTRTIKGYAPITFNSIGIAPSSLVLYGNSTQETEDEEYIEKTGEEIAAGGLDTTKSTFLKVNGNTEQFTQDEDTQDYTSATGAIQVSSEQGFPLKNYTIFGNTKQDTTTGKNLVDINIYKNTSKTSSTILLVENNKIEWTNNNTDSYFPFIYNVSMFSNSDLINTLIEIEPNTIYTLSFDIDKTSGKVYVYDGDSSRNGISILINANLSDKKYTFKTSENAKYIIVRFAKWSTTETATITNLQLEKGSTATSYESYTGGIASPNPSYPQSIESVGELNNLFNGTYENYIIGDDGTLIKNTDWNISQPIYDILPNHTFFMEWENIDDTLIPQLEIGEYKSDGTFIKNNFKNMDLKATKFSIKLSNNTNSVRIGYRNARMKNILLYEQGKKYAIPVTVASENLLNVIDVEETTVNGIKYSINNGKVNISGTPINTNYLLLNTFENELTLNEGEYTLKITTPIENSYIVLLDSSKTWVGNAVRNGSKTFTLSSTKKVKYIACGDLNTSKKVSGEDIEIMLYKGSTAKPYQPYYNKTDYIYLNEPLRKIGDTQDYIDYANKQVVRNINEIVLNGSENIWYSQTQGDYYLFQIVNNLAKRGKIAISNKFIYKSNWGTNKNYESIEMSFNENILIQIKILSSRLSENTKSAVKSWLATNNVTVDYILATPTTETIELPIIATQKGSNNIVCNTELTPSQLKVTVVNKYQYPSPEHPSEIESVGELNNLFDKTTITTDSYITAAGAINTQFDDINLSDYILLKANTTYNFTTRGTWKSVGIYDESKTFIERATIDEAYTPTQNVYARVNIPDDYLNGFILYEQGKKYAIPVTVESKNILNLNNYNGTTNGITITRKDGVITVKGTATAYTQTMYTTLNNRVLTEEEIFSSKLEGNYNGVSVKFQYKKNGESSSVYPTINNHTQKLNIGDTLNQIYLIINNGSTIDCTIYLQLEKGATATEYQPYYNSTNYIYLDQPLRKIGNVSDYIDFKYGKVHRKIKEETLTRNSLWSEATYGYLIQNYITSKNPYMHCNYFKCQNNYNTWTSNNYFGINSAGVLWFRMNDDLKSEWLDWLDEHNLIIDYVLASEEVETITLPEIEYISGANVISAAAATKPTFDFIYNYEPAMPSPERPSEIKSVGTNIKEENGTDEVHLTNASAGNLINYKIQGNTYQESTKDIKEEYSGVGTVTFDNKNGNDNELKINGNTYQNTTQGYNLANVTGNKQGNGITATYANQKATIKGTMTNTYSDTQIGQVINLSKMTSNRNVYTMITKAINVNICFRITYDDGTYSQSSITIGNTRGTVSITANKQPVQYRTWIWADKGTVVDIEDLGIMICETDNQPYEPYTNGASPNPDFPQEIESVGELNNLYNQNNILKNVSIETTDGTITSNSTNNILFFEIEKNKKYIFNYENDEEVTGNTIVAFTNDKPAIDVNYYSPNIVVVSNLKNYTFTNTNYNYFLVRLNNATQLPKLKNILFYEDGKKYKVPITISSENLFNKNTLKSATGYTVDEDGWITTTYDNSSGTSTKYVDVFTNNLNLKTNTNYVIFTEIRNIIGTGSFFLTSSYGQFAYDIKYGFENLTSNSTKKIVVKSKNDFSNVGNGLRSFLRLDAGQSGSITFRLSVLVDTTITTDNFKYQPYYNSTSYIYLNEPLRKIGDVADEIENGVVTRKIKEVILNGSENSWTKQTKYYQCDLNVEAVTGNALCNYYRYNNSSLLNTFYVTTSFFRVNDNITTLDEYKTWLSSNNVIVDYILATPTTEIIDLPEIEYITGVNILSANTEIKPTINLVSYEQHQSPTPDYPQEVESVGELQNLFDINDITRNVFIFGQTGNVYGTTGGSSASNSSNFIEVKPNTKYILEYNYATLKGEGYRAYVFYTDEKVGIDRGYDTLYNSSNKKNNFTSPSNAKYIRFTYDQNCTDIVFYEQGKKYAIPVTVASENLCDYDFVKNMINVSNGEINNGVTGYVSTRNFIKVKSNTDYILSYKKIDDTNSMPCFFKYDENYNYLGYEIGKQYQKSITISTGNDVKYIKFRIRNESDIMTDIYDIMFNLGSTAKPYQPYYNTTTNIYLNEPLRKIGDTMDYVDYANKQVVRNINEVVLNGSENKWYKSTTTGSMILTLNEYGIAKKRVICSHFISPTYVVMGTQNYQLVFISTAPIEDTTIGDMTSDDFKSWLVTNNVTVDYIVETPTTETINLPDIAAVAGVNNITIGTETSSSKFYVKYNSDKYIPLTLNDEKKYIETGMELQRVGDVYDYIDYNENKLYKNIGEYTITGEEDWKISTTEGDYTIFNMQFDKSTGVFKCNRFKSTESTLSKEKMTLTTSTLQIKTDKASTVDTFKQWLKTNEVKIKYIMKETEVINLTTAEINPINGDNTLTTTCEVKPEIDITYKSNK